jgi:hypothetical protein
MFGEGGKKAKNCEPSCKAKRKKKPPNDNVVDTLKSGERKVEVGK